MAANPAPDPPTETLRAARDAHARQDWPRAFELFTIAGDERRLTADDLASLSSSAWWLGRSDESLQAGEQAHRLYLRDGQPRQAAVAAIELAVEHFLRGDESIGFGWVSRAQRLLEDEPEGAEHGLLLYLVEVEGPLGGITPSQPAAAEALVASSRRVADIGRRHGDADLVACGVLGEGRALVKLGRVSEGLALLDESMLAVLSGELSPDLAGNVYCHLMSAAHELADVRRSVAWTEATARWLEGLPAAVLFTGICRVHRSQVHQVTGAWERAETEAARVCVDLAQLQPATAAEAHYQVGEIRRLRGALTEAEEAYQQARRLGRDPQPGVALLRLAQGKVDAASASIRAALIAEADRLARAPLCAAQVDIALVAGDHAAARDSCEELEQLAATYASSGLEVMARHARGATLLADRRPEEALPVLRDACRRWQDLEAPYECARIRVLLGAAYTAVGDADAAALELDAAAESFEALGATVDVQEVAALRGASRELPDGLTAREAEVLALVAAGMSNRDVAGELVISQKTVARHLSNIFTKLGLSSRTAAAAYAYEHDLVTRA